MIAILVIVTVAAFVVSGYLAGRYSSRRPATSRVSVGLRTLNDDAARAVLGGDPHELRQLPSGVFMSPEHAWLELEPTGSVRVGSGKLPLNVLGGLDRIEVQNVGSTVRAGEPLAVLRREGRELPLRSPVDGTISRVNSRLTANPGQVQADPFGAGWLYQIQPRGLSASLRRSFVAEEAGAWMAKEVGRLRDFAAELAAPRVELAPTLQDGGLPVDGLAQLVSDEDWDRFVDRFFDTRTEHHA